MTAQEGRRERHPDPASRPGERSVAPAEPETLEPIRQMESLLRAAEQMEAELAEPQPDLDLLEQLMAERSEAQRRVAHWFERRRQAGTDERRADGRDALEEEMAALARAVLECDRRTAERATALRRQALEGLREVKGRRGAADAYRRAVIEPARQDGAFFDGQI
ncbi:hypothetical protein U7230_08730 [Carboxydochorda subterranea]|uniref:Uncharacterized protein n=1 Tax=Carboxydichorda subterranea TaxID=3109565 RepID=A0ABZ1BUB9_9FIRM|nr:hypothetical protein [Limnochorda sp. L945t]WRP16188.1 hypothetical protein U7230_08730 [Limnochorda sp. L945t]